MDLCDILQKPINTYDELIDLLSTNGKAQIYIGNYLINKYINENINKATAFENWNIINILIYLNLDLYNCRLRSDSWFVIGLLNKAVKALTNKLNEEKNMKSTLHHIILNFQSLFVALKICDCKGLNDSVYNLYSVIIEKSKKEGIKLSELLTIPIIECHNTNNSMICSQSVISNNNSSISESGNKSKIPLNFDKIINEQKAISERHKEQIKLIIDFKELSQYFENQFKGIIFHCIGTTKYKLFYLADKDRTIDIVAINNHEQVNANTTFNEIINTLSTSKGSYKSFEIQIIEDKTKVEKMTICLDLVNKNKDRIKVNLILFNKKYKKTASILKQFYLKYDIFKKLHIFFQSVIIEKINLIQSRYELSILLLDYLEGYFKIFNANKVEGVYSYYIATKDKALKKIKESLYYYELDENSLANIQKNTTIDVLILGFAEYIKQYLLYLNIEYNRKVFGINLVENNKALLEEKNINNLFIDKKFLLNRCCIDDYYLIMNLEQYNSIFLKLYSQYNSFYELLTQSEGEINSINELFK